MNGFLPKLTKLQILQALCGLAASLLAIAGTLAKWGLTEAIRGVTPLVILLACLCVILGGLVLIAWVGRKWGPSNTLRGVAPWLPVVACVSVALAGLAVLATTLQTHGWAGTLCTMTCLLWLLSFSVKHCAWLWRHLRGRNTTQVVENGSPGIPSPMDGLNEEMSGKDSARRQCVLERSSPARR